MKQSDTYWKWTPLQKRLADAFYHVSATFVRETGRPITFGIDLIVVDINI